MLFLIAALMLMGVALGTVAHVPVDISLAATAAIACWLLVFAVRERSTRRHRPAGRQEGRS
ncbi:hypothetical protein AB0C90_09185 [Streptomyces sp. NPDC048550]|uniref:hypothetical protein n=1 Tax=unclassified Streptomyces TaxID=2593676 RepID=UPI000A5921B6|nr:MULTISPECIES: hypothetical protein [unclassified Streptomyces]MCX5149690.1 hypothetical protein [Streptomyces sp. NBC_00320]WSN52730.1 hypothetical protein OG299_36135 [Streptomyces sp. NBC_01296]WSW57761.1 hypothetical protein OG513_03780 [Streptomyces sp. NBC_00998]